MLNNLPKVLQLMKGRATRSQHVKEIHQKAWAELSRRAVEKGQRVKERQEDNTCSGNSLNEGADVRIKLQNLINDLQDKSSPPSVFFLFFLHLSFTN